MIEGNVIKFGYGTILVSATFCNQLILQYVQPAQIIGEKAQGKCEVIQELVFNYDKEMSKLYSDLLSINENNTQLIYKDYIFDFSQFNRKSLDIVVKGVKHILGFVQLSLAC